MCNVTTLCSLDYLFIQLSCLVNLTLHGCQLLPFRDVRLKAKVAANQLLSFTVYAADSLDVKYTSNCLT